MLRSLMLLPLVLAAFCGHATTYYLSPSGSDSNNGTSPATAWRTIDRLVQGIWSLQPGDQILFQRGGTYRGQFFIPVSGTASNPIVVGAYGSGDAPVVSGSVQAINWTQHAGNIWRASVPGTVRQVYIGGQLQTLARFPNSGWLRNVQGSTTTLYDNTLTQSNGHWTGATAVIRNTNWCYENRTVSGFNNGTLSFPALTYSLGGYNWGYFLCNKLSMLDAPGEYYHDAATGQLYLWAPGSVDPNTLLVEASTRARGITVNFGREHVRVENITFQHQHEAGIWVDGADRVTITNCTFRDLYHGIRATGNQCAHHANTLLRTYATGIMVYGDDNEVASNVLTDIALIPGLGESTWGYKGIHCYGNGNAIRDNRLTNIGYSAIFVRNDCVVERNVVRNAVAILNDGGGIHWDNSDGMVIQDNIVTDLEGSLESVANEATDFPIHRPICHGIYFGCVSIRNTVVQRNTCARNASSGIHVDHTMVSSGNIVRDNVLFDNNIQLSLSDYSNYNGPGASPPFHVPAFNGTYTGNVMYCLKAEQQCMRQLGVYSTTPVDFGTFTNNRYFNPWNELSIVVQLIPNGEQRPYALERWQFEHAKDAGSTRSPLRLDAYATQSVLSGNLVLNGTFDQSVDGWWYWPTNGSVSRDVTYLDNGALKAQLTSGSQYPELFVRNPDLFTIQNGQWYRMRFSLQSNVHGILKAGVKGNSQLSGGEVVNERLVPFDGQRRDMEFHFQAGMSDQSMVQFVNSYLQSRYWVDNVELHRVTVQPIDPNNDHMLLENDQPGTVVVALPPGCWFDVLGVPLGTSVSLPAFSSKVVYRVNGPECATVPTNTVGARVLLGGAMDWSTGAMRSDLRTLGLIPENQPYTAMGISVSNNGQLITPDVMQATGPDAIVDWVVLELRQNSSSYTVLERRAALVKANGDVISNNGSPQIVFSSTVQGRYLAVRHRNHLSAMAAEPIPAGGATIDFTSPAVPLFGVEAMYQEDGVRVLWPGDVNGNGEVSYAGSDNDRDPVLQGIGGTVPSATEMGYSVLDANLDGVVKYTGSANDRDVILMVIGGLVPTAVRFGQMP